MRLGILAVMSLILVPGMQETPLIMGSGQQIGPFVPLGIELPTMITWCFFFCLGSGPPVCLAVAAGITSSPPFLHQGCQGPVPVPQT